MGEPPTRSEVWRDVPGHEGAYQVSDMGRVRSLPRKIARANGRPMEVGGTLLRPGTTQSGVLHVCLWRGGKAHAGHIRNLVLAAFVGPAPPGCVGNHVNGDFQDCRLENLRWGPPRKPGKKKA